jgi:8-oxo-dGTP diphosphatase
MIELVCGIIYKGDEVLICRWAAHKSLGGFWEFPGGKVEQGKSKLNSLERELMEELGMEVIDADYFIEHSHHYGDLVIKLIAYKCQFKAATFVMTDYDDYLWVLPTSLDGFELAPADVPIAGLLVG